MIFAIAVWFCAMPAGWLVGLEMGKRVTPDNPTILGAAAAIFPPAAAVLAAYLILEGEMNENQ